MADKKQTFDEKDVEDNKIIAALSYLGILVLVPLLLKQDSPFVQAHAKQGLVLLGAFILLGFIPFLGWFVAVFLAVVDLMALVMALQGKYMQIPVAHNLAQKFNL